MTGEIVARYFDLVRAEALVPVLCFFLPMALFFLWKNFLRFRKTDRLSPNVNTGISWLLFVFSCGIGLWSALSKASVFDDAFISFRYARNFAEGNGLVFNIGERVEGYTNFLWTLLIGVITALTDFDAAETGLVLSVIAFSGNAIIVYLLGQKLWRDSNLGIYVPISAMLMSVNMVITDYGTSGLETGAASLLVNLGMFHLLFATSARGFCLSGLFFCLAVFTRPDHSIFYVTGGLTILITEIIHVRKIDPVHRATAVRESLRKIFAYSASMIGYVAYLFFKLHYYGSIVPNTYYAKSAGEYYFSQGWIYTVTFLTGTHYWVIALLLAAALLVSNRNTAVSRLKIFAATSVPLYVLYIVKIGGDFMYGRFFVTLIPIILLVVEQWIHLMFRQADSRRRVMASLLVVGVLSATAFGVDIIGDKQKRWRVANESSFYRIQSAFPLVMEDVNQQFGKFLNASLKKKGIEPVISTGAIGMVGYYSELELVDSRGLTDRHVAQQPVGKRGTPGHEKRATLAYLQGRKVAFGRINQRAPERFRKLLRIQFRDIRPSGNWEMITYPGDLMRQIAAFSPEITFVDFEAYLDEYIKTLRSRSPQQTADDLRWFESYYFNHNLDSKRYEPIRAHSLRVSPI